MIIETASTRLIIDLLYSLKKNSYNSSNIRISYIYENGLIKFKTFNNLDELVSFYINTYKYLLASLKTPFTEDRNHASYGKISKFGELISRQLDSILINKNQNIFKIGPFVGIESLRLTNDILGFNLVYNCKDISDNYSIIQGRSFNNTKDINRSNQMIKFKNRIIAFIKIYQTIQKELYKSWNASLYVELLNSNIGYVEETIKLFKIYFPLVKDRIDKGLRLTVLNPRYIKRIDL